jgi:hypothetical protein
MTSTKAVNMKKFFIFDLVKSIPVYSCFDFKGMKMLIRIIILGLIFMGSSFSIESCSQSKSMRDIERRSSRSERLLNKSETKKVRQAKEKAEDQKEREKKKYEKAKKEDNERRMELQTAETQKRMKETRKKSDEYNNQGHESFFKRLFKRKKPKS